MKFIKKTLILLCAALALVFSFALAACGDGEEEGSYKLSFETFGGTVCEPIEAEAGEDISARLPADPEKADNVFGGWYLDSGCTQAAQLPTVMPAENRTYYAKWTPAFMGTSTLTLNAGNGGVLQTTVYTVPVGADLAAFLADKTPTPAQGLTFAGWYRGNAAIGTGDTMPETRLTVTAKYYAQYTVEVFTENADGTYPAEGETVTGRAFYGEAFSCADVVETPEHFELTAGAGGAISTEALGADSSFVAYLARERYYITYAPNAPQGAQVTGATPMQTVRFGEQAKVTACGFVLGGNSRYRCAGWATGPDGAAVYHAGDAIELTASVTLYAVWEKGYTDIFNGQDVLYPDGVEEGVIRLVREGVEEKVGEYDEETALFAFKEGNETVLDGKLLFGAEKFFYFRDTVEGEYADLDGTSATLVMGKGGAAVYTDAKGAEHTGKYSIDPDTGYFLFDDDAGETGDFSYNLFNTIDGDEVVFRRQSTEEYGYYYDAEAGIVLYLDGLGGLRYYYNEKNAEYQDFMGNPLYYAPGYYEWKAELGLFLAETYDIASTLKQFTFKTAQKTGVAIPQGESYPDLPASATVKGELDLDDELRGDYIAKREDSENTLTLDGYGNAAFGGQQGSYEKFTWLYSYEEEDGEVTDDYYLVRFTPDDGSGVIYFRLDTAYGDYEFDRTISAAQLEAHAGYDFGRFEVRDLFLLNVTFDGFIMIFENGEAEVWTQYGLTTNGNPVYVLYIELVSSVEKEGNVYTFQKTRTTTGQYYENEFRFTVDAAKRTVSVILPEPHVTANVAEGLTLDYTARKATYRGEEVDYWYTIGYIDFYTFAIGEDEEFNFWVESGKTSEFHPVSEEDVYDLYLLSGEEGLISRLLFTADKKNAYLAYMLDSGMYRFVGYGSVTEEENGDSRFVLERHIDDMTDADFREDGYDTFEFRYSDDGIFRKKSIPEAFQFSNFTTEGYGIYVYTDDGGVAHSGMIADSIGEGPSLLVYLEEATTGIEFILAVDKNNPNKLISCTEDAGYWYEMNDNQRISLYKYMILNGQGSVYYYEINDLTGELNSALEGTYRHSPGYAGQDADEPFPEYTLTMNGEDGGTTVNDYLLATYPLINEETGEIVSLPIYQAKIAHRVGNFQVKGGGSIESLGYPGEEATYDDGHGNILQGNMYIGTAGGGIRNHDFVNDANGEFVRFWVYTDGRPTATEYLFAMSGDTLAEVTLPCGDFASASRDGIDEGRVLSLDGFGAASLKEKEGHFTFEGEYSLVRGTEEYLFTSRDLNFRFRVGSRTEEARQIFIYEEYGQEGNAALYNASDWSLLTLDGFGGAVFLNHYGDRIIGSYTLFAAGLGAFESDSLNFVFTYGEGAYEAVDHARYLACYYAEDFSSVVFTDTRVIANGAEYFYTVEGQTVNLYTVQGEHTASTIDLPAGETYLYKNTTYYAYDGGELVFTDGEYDPGHPIELRFTPDGAAFTAEADFAGLEGYHVVVSYDGTTVKAMLTYRANTLDALLEEYPLTLHYTAAAKTFTVVPVGGTGTYTQEDGSQNNTITLDNRRVGAYSVALHDVDAGSTLVVAFNGILDSKGEPLAFSGSVSAMKDGLETHFSYGYSHIVEVTGSDGIVYTVRFFLNEQGKAFLLHSILVEKKIEVAGVGEVTFSQLWTAGTDYIGEAKYALVDVSMRETGVEKDMDSGALGENRAVLVRQSLNTTAGNYSYEAYVFDITYGEDRFLATAQKAGNYGYGEAEQGSSYKLCFLYNLDAETFEVSYLLHFAAGGPYLDDAVFEKGADGWTVTVGGSTESEADDKTYRVSITQSGEGFALTVKEL